MKRKNFILFFVLCFAINISNLNAQNYKYYVTSINKEFNPGLVSDGSSLRYNGKDEALYNFFDSYEIYTFKKAFSNSQKPRLQRSFYLESSSPDLEPIFQKDLAHIFDFVEALGPEEPILTYYPNDYGVTGGLNQGAPANLQYLDFIGVPFAWDYTTGSSDIKVGISDGGPLQADNDEFKGKTTVLLENLDSPDHGNNVTAIIAAQGDNGYVATGVCYDCGIIKNGYKSIPGQLGDGFERILELAEAGAKVINCSWVGLSYSSLRQKSIDELTENGVIIVAGSGNSRSSNFPNSYSYPASFRNVISVGAVGSKNDLDCSNLTGNYIPNVKNYLSGKVKFFQSPNCSLPLEDQAYLETANIATLNDSVDIVAPGSGHFRFNQYVNNNVIEYIPDTDLWTSPSTPLVTGTIGLMVNINNNLSFSEVESILKITSTNIDDILANQIVNGYYGSGTLHTGRAVQLTNNLKNTDSTAYLQNQKFSRWDFIFNGVSKNIIVQNQEFTEGSTVRVKAKNRITLEEGTLLEPNSDGFAILEIDPSLTIPSNGAFKNIESSDSQNKKPPIDQMIYKVYPTIVDDKVNIVNIVSDDAIVKNIKIFDIMGRMVIEKNNILSEKIILTGIDLPSGVYIIKGYNKNNEDVLTEKFIKN